jgi:glycosyltransferase involved in cell wall biosynthesis
LTAAGLDPFKLHLKPNSVADPGDPPPPGGDLLFIGRLDEQKGITLLLEAWRRTRNRLGRKLIVAGDGPLRDLVRTVAEEPDANVRMLGVLTTAQVREQIWASGVVVVPSVGQETFGRVAVEAMAGGRPVVATNMGALGEIVKQPFGILIEPSLEALEHALEQACTWSDLAARGRIARQQYLTHYAPMAVTASLVNHYEEVIADNSRARKPHGP